MNNEQDPIVNVGDKPKSDKQGILVAITIVTLLLALYGKLITMGWMTILLIWSFILPLHFILFTKAGIRLAKKENKMQFDYICFGLLCVTILLYTYTFVDVGDISSSKAIDFISEGILSKISAMSFCTNIVLIVISFIRCKRR